MDKIPFDERYVLSSLNNALKILELLMVRDDITLNDIAKLTNMNKSSIYKMLYTLEYRNFVKKNKNATYQLGERLSNYASTAYERQNLLDIADKYIWKLWGKTQQAITLCTLNAYGKVVFIAIKLGVHTSTINGRIGAEMDWYTNSAGKLLLSHSNTETQKKIINSTVFKRHTDKTVIDMKILNQQLLEYKHKDILITFEENRINHGDIASPIYDHEGNCIACLGMVYEVDQSMNNLKYYQEQIQITAQELTNALR